MLRRLWCLLYNLSYSYRISTDPCNGDPVIVTCGRWFETPEETNARHKKKVDDYISTRCKGGA